MPSGNTSGPSTGRLVEVVPVERNDGVRGADEHQGLRQPGHVTGEGVDQPQPDKLSRPGIEVLGAQCALRVADNHGVVTVVGRPHVWLDHQRVIQPAGANATTPLHFFRYLGYY